MRFLLIFLVLLLPFSVAYATGALPGDSVYQLKVHLTNQDGYRQLLSARRGRPQLVTMFYASCNMVCPLVVDSMRATRNALDPAERARIDLLAVSFDPTHDSVAELHRYAEKRSLVAPAWTVARAGATEVRQLASVLGLQYRQLPDGEFNHSSGLILLDAEGRVVARTNRVGQVDPAFVEAIHRQLGGT